MTAAAAFGWMVIAAVLGAISSIIVLPVARFAGRRRQRKTPTALVAAAVALVAATLWYSIPVLAAAVYWTF
jgi:hypothetical protein